MSSAALFCEGPRPLWRELPELPPGVALLLLLRPVLLKSVHLPLELCGIECCALLSLEPLKSLLLLKAPQARSDGRGCVATTLLARGVAYRADSTTRHETLAMARFDGRCKLVGLVGGSCSRALWRCAARQIETKTECLRLLLIDQARSHRPRKLQLYAQEAHVMSCM